MKRQARRHYARRVLKEDQRRQKDNLRYELAELDMALLEGERYNDLEACLSSCGQDRSPGDFPRSSLHLTFDMPFGFP